jgi:hypothetical protein
MDLLFLVLCIYDTSFSIEHQIQADKLDVLLSERLLWQYYDTILISPLELKEKRSRAGSSKWCGLERLSLHTGQQRPGSKNTANFKLSR